jgi:dTDP-4-amino-4,6-dideoxygalactose transaminase
MEKIVSLAKSHGLFVIEDAALAFGTYYNGKAAGSFGHLSTFSFHSTKNITCGEGGLLVVNDERFIKRAEIIREKGTNRNAFFRGEVDKYGWTDTGSSFLPSDILAAFFYAQLEVFDTITTKRLDLWNFYHAELSGLAKKGVQLPCLRDENKINASIYYLVCRSLEERTKLLEFCEKSSVQLSFHYQALHRSEFYKKIMQQSLPLAEHYSDCLVRLPLYPSLDKQSAQRVADLIHQFYR